MSIDKFRDYGHEQSSIDQTVKGFSDTLKQARQKRVKAWFAEKWEYLSDQDFLIDTAALCIVIAMICWAFGIGKWFIECAKVAHGG